MRMHAHKDSSEAFDNITEGHAFLRFCRHAFSVGEKYPIFAHNDKAYTVK